MSAFSLHEFARAVRDSALDAEQSLVAYTIATYASSDDATTYVGSETLAKATRLHENTVRKVMQSLEANGVLVRVSGGIGGRTVRRLDVAAVAGAAPRSAGRRQGTPPRAVGVQDDHRTDTVIVPPPPRAVGLPHTGRGPTGRGGTPHGQWGTPPRAVEDPPTGSGRSDQGSVPGSDQNNTPPPPSPGGAAHEHTDNAADVGVPRWARLKGHRSHDVLGSVVRAIGAITGRVVNPERCATDAKHVIALQRATNTPWNELADQVELVAEWARESDDPLAARDIRAEGWATGVDRSRSVLTICVQGRWSERLNAAEEWASSVEEDLPIVINEERSPPRMRPHA